MHILATGEIPEPSTYAAISGLAVLGWVVWQRRRRSVRLQQAVLPALDQPENGNVAEPTAMGAKQIGAQPASREN